MIGALSFLSILNDLKNALEALTLLFADDVKMKDLWVLNISLLRPFRIQDIYGPIRCWSELFFSSPTGGGLRGHPNKALQDKNNRRKKGPAFSERAVKYRNNLPAPAVTATGKIFKKRLKNVWTEVFHRLPR